MNKDADSWAEGRQNFGSWAWGWIRNRDNEEEREKVDGGEEAMGWVSYENLAMRAGRLELRTAQIT